jgi:hypothetical protein
VKEDFEVMVAAELAPDRASLHTRVMPSSHGKQKQAAKQKKKRELARRSVMKRTPDSLAKAALLRQAATLPMGPTYISADWRIDSTDPPRLVSILITRRAPGGVLMPGIALVDRTCLGVKNGFVAEPISAIDVPNLVAQLGQAHEGGMVPCDPLVAQSIVYHAIDHARSLGFEPHRDFPEPLFGPRPAALLDTPLAHPERPVYVPGPDDNVERVLARLDAAVGSGNYTFRMLAPGGGAVLSLDADEDETDAP